MRHLCDGRSAYDIVWRSLVSAAVCRIALLFCVRGIESLFSSYIGVSSLCSLLTCRLGMLAPGLTAISVLVAPAIMCRAHD